MKNQKIILWTLPLVLTLSITAIRCSKNNDDSNSSSGSSNVTLHVKSSALTSGSSSSLKKSGLQKPQILSQNTNASQGTVVTVGTTCVTMNSMEWCNYSISNQTDNNYFYTAKEGYCATPRGVSGGISAIALASIGKGGIAPRILGGGMELSGNKDGKLDVQVLDFSKANELVGVDNIEDATPPADGYNGFQILLSHLDIKMPALIESGNSTQYYYTVRYVFFTQPLNDESVIQSCGIDAPYLEKLNTNSMLLGTQKIKRNDILICVKNSSTEECKDADYLWLDVTTEGAETFTSTRPATAVTYRQEVVPNSNLDCSLSSAGIPDMSAGGLGIYGTLASNVQVSATNDKGVKTYTVGSTSGTTLDVVLDIYTTNTAFIETSGAPIQQYIDTFLQADTTGATLAQRIQFIPAYVRYKLATKYICNNDCSYTERDSGLHGTMTVTTK